ncbi:HD domain-containing protein [Acinetobacter sp. TSRC1-2]|uniref:HD domain-containing protein n=1 Tax=unclassified Acinetobacter TaxID=196816 RepID=UPI003CFB264A
MRLEKDSLCCNNKQYFSDPYFIKSNIYQMITSTSAFRRLDGITFLGAIGLVEKVNGKKDISRAQHSINIASLIYKISNARCYDQELTKHLCVAGLLNDIGHFPLSHSVSGYLSRKLNMDHHALGSLIIDGEFSQLSDLNKILKNNLDITFIKSLLDKKIEKDLGGDIFSSKFNVSTINGIYQSGLFIGYDFFDKDKIVNEVFLKSSRDINYRLLDQFWESKDFIYNQFIQSEFGLFVDNIGELFFKKNKNTLDINDLLSIEKTWHKKFFFMKLFKNLDSSSLLSNYRGRTFYLPKEINGSDQLFYKKRKYTVNTNETSLSNRYICLMNMEKQKKFNDKIPTKNLSLF